MRLRLPLLSALAAALLAAPSPAALLDAASLAVPATDAALSTVRSAARAFETAVKAANDAADAKRADLDQKTATRLTQEKDRAQAAGDLDKTLALKKVVDAKAWDAPSDIPLVKQLQEARAKGFAAIEAERVQAGFAAAKALNDATDAAKTAATRSGKLEEAQALAAYQARVRDWASALKAANTASSTAAKPTASAAYPETAVAKPASAPTLVSVAARSFNGTVVAKDVRRGNKIVFRYKSGTWRTGRTDFSPNESPDDNVLTHDINAASVAWFNPSTRRLENIARIPSGTANTPWTFLVPDDGTYSIRISDNENYAGDFNDNYGTVKYEVTIIPSASALRPSGVTSATPRNAPATTPVPARSGGPTTKKTVSVDSSKKGGTQIGFVPAGSTIRIRYLSGKWTWCVGQTPKTNPDTDDWGPWGGVMQTVLAVGPGEGFIEALPHGTANEPFEFVADEDARYYLKMRDEGVYDNGGSVRYEVEIIPPVK